MVHSAPSSEREAIASTPSPPDSRTTRRSSLLKRGTSFPCGSAERASASALPQAPTPSGSAASGSESTIRRTRRNADRFGDPRHCPDGHWQHLRSLAGGKASIIQPAKPAIGIDADPAATGVPAAIGDGVGGESRNVARRRRQEPRVGACPPIPTACSP